MVTATATLPKLLPHQFHRAKGTIKKTPTHIARVKAAQKREKAKKNDSARDPRFHYASKKFIKQRLAQGLGCEACGSKIGLQTHHVVPFHTDKKLEMDQNNWIILCEYVGGLECHEHVGHGGEKGGFKRFNPRVREDAAELMAHPERLKEIWARIVKKALPNEPGANKKTA